MYVCEEIEFDQYSKRNNFKEIEDRIMELFEYSKMEYPDITIDRVNTLIQCLKAWYYKYNMSEELLSAAIFSTPEESTYLFEWWYQDLRVILNLEINIVSWKVVYRLDSYKNIKNCYEVQTTYDRMTVYHWTKLCNTIKHDIANGKQYA